MHTHSNTNKAKVQITLTQFHGHKLWLHGQNFSNSIDEDWAGSISGIVPFLLVYYSDDEWNIRVHVNAARC